MTTYYLTSDSGRINRVNETLMFIDNISDNKKQIFPHRTEQVVLVGNIEISNQALKLLMKHGIDTVFLNKNGQYNGKLVFQENGNVFLRKKQYLKTEDKEFSVSFAKEIVSAKIKNQITFAQRIKRKDNLQDNKTIPTAIFNLKNLLKKLDTVETMNEIRGIEGMAARHYYSVYGKAFLIEWTEFKGRSKHPPKDPINAVLSFLYTLIFHRVDLALVTVGLDTYAGFLHELSYGRRSLSLDIMEQFRTPIAETLTLSLFNQRTLREEDFETRKIDDTDEFSDEGTFLTREGIKRVITKFETKMDNTFFYPAENREIQYKDLFILQAQHLKRVLNDTEEKFLPWVFK